MAQLILVGIVVVYLLIFILILNIGRSLQRIYIEKNSTFSGGYGYWINDKDKKLQQKLKWIETSGEIFENGSFTWPIIPVLFIGLLLWKITVNLDPFVSKIVNKFTNTK